MTFSRGVNDLFRINASWSVFTLWSLHESRNSQFIFRWVLTGRSEGESAGLGLAICDGIVKEHSGWIAAASQQDKGCTFSIYLPSEET